jgi:hypothetical protein
MLRLLYTLTITAALWLTSCLDTIYYDATPGEVASMTIAAEGGSFEFQLVEYEILRDTRFQPGEWFKYYRYRVVEDGVAGEESENVYDNPDVWIDFVPNDSDHTKEYTIDVKVAKDFYRYDEEHHFGEWQTVWHITQPSMVGE